MKYIRTDKGIYEVVGFDDECIIPSPIIKMDGKLTHCSDYKNCKQADTIEELCDGFYVDKCKEEVLIDEIFDYCWYDFNPYFKSCAKDGIDVYGFIKTDKGLIYVAKMNDKGELELI